MIKLHNNLIGSETAPHSNFTLEGSDSYDNYQLNLKSQPQDWIYRNKDITYKRNVYGHRSVDVETLDKDFVLFAGCSITFGSGLALEDTYPYLVSKSLGMDYYNLSVEASGPDVVTHNLFSWAQHIKKRPAYIVVQWPEPYRFFHPSDDPKYLLGPWIDYIKHLYDKPIIDKYYKVIETDVLEHYYKIMRLSVTTYIQALGIPCYQFETKDIEVVDVARDLKHPGIETNKKLADLVVNSLSSQKT